MYMIGGQNLIDVNEDGMIQTLKNSGDVAEPIPSLQFDANIETEGGEFRSRSLR